MKIAGFLLCVLLVASCNTYHKIYLTKADLQLSPRFEKKVPNYRVYVHKDGEVTEYKNPKVEGNLLKGYEVEVPADSIVEFPVTKSAIKQHRRIYICTCCPQ